MAVRVDITPVGAKAMNSPRPPLMCLCRKPMESTRLQRQLYSSSLRQPSAASQHQEASRHIVAAARGAVMLRLHDQTAPLSCYAGEPGLTNARMRSACMLTAAHLVCALTAHRNAPLSSSPPWTRRCPSELRSSRASPQQAVQATQAGFRPRIISHADQLIEHGIAETIDGVMTKINQVLQDHVHGRLDHRFVSPHPLLTPALHWGQVVVLGMLCTQQCRPRAEGMVNS